jgi:hypothetical protein
LTLVYNPGNQGSDDGGGDNGILFRQYIPSSAFINAGIGATQFRVTLLGGSFNGTNTTTIGTVWFGRAAASSTLNFNGNQVQCLFGGAGTFINTGTNSWTETSDWANFAGGETFDPTQNYILAFFIDFNATGGCSQASYTVSGANLQYVFRTGADTSGDTNSGTGWNSAGSNTLQMLDTVEVQGASGDVLYAQIWM